MPRRNKKHDIMAAAENLFSNRSYHEVTLDEIAHQAKVGKGTLYRYFSNKDDLFFQTATSGFDELCAAILNLKIEGKTFTEQLLTVCSEIEQFFFHRRQLFRLMQIEEARVIWGQGSMWDLWLFRRRKMVQAVSEILDAGVKEEQIRTDIPTPILADFLLGMLRSRARYFVKIDDAFRRLEILLDVFIYGASGNGNEINIKEFCDGRE